MTLSAHALKRLGQLVPMLSSDKDGEVVASVRAIARILSAEGKDFHDLTKLLTREPVIVYKIAFRDPPKPEPTAEQRQRRGWSPFGENEWLAKAEYCAEHLGDLSPREADFVADMVEKLKRWGEPTEKQASWLGAIHSRMRRRYGETG